MRAPSLRHSAHVQRRGDISSTIAHNVDAMLRHKNPFVDHSSNPIRDESVLAFELAWADVVGFDHSARLMKDARLVLEAKHLLKRVFASVSGLGVKGALSSAGRGQGKSEGTAVVAVQRVARMHSTSGHNIPATHIFAAGRPCAPFAQVADACLYYQQQYQLPTPADTPSPSGASSPSARRLSQAGCRITPFGSTAVTPRRAEGAMAAQSRPVTPQQPQRAGSQFSGGGRGRSAPPDLVNGPTQPQGQRRQQQGSARGSLDPAAGGSSPAAAIHGGSAPATQALLQATRPCGAAAAALVMPQESPALAGGGGATGKLCAARTLSAAVSMSTNLDAGRIAAAAAAASSGDSGSESSAAPTLLQRRGGALQRRLSIHTHVAAKGGPHGAAGTASALSPEAQGVWLSPQDGTFPSSPSSGEDRAHTLAFHSQPSSPCAGERGDCPVHPMGSAPSGMGGVGRASLPLLGRQASGAARCRRHHRRHHHGVAVAATAPASPVRGATHFAAAGGGAGQLLGWGSTAGSLSEHSLAEQRRQPGSQMLALLQSQLQPQQPLQQRQCLPGSPCASSRGGGQFSGGGGAPQASSAGRRKGRQQHCPLCQQALESEGAVAASGQIKVRSSSACSLNQLMAGSGVASARHLQGSAQPAASAAAADASLPASPGTAGSEHAGGQLQGGSRYHCRTVIMTFTDPTLPQQLGRCLKDDVHLLKLYESGLPAWAIFLPSYGLWYRPWLRRLTWLLFILVGARRLVECKCMRALQAVLGARGREGSLPPSPALVHYGLYRHLPQLMGRAANKLIPTAPCTPLPLTPWQTHRSVPFHWRWASTTSTKTCPGSRAGW